jgi:hypothetical protein
MKFLRVNGQPPKKAAMRILSPLDSDEEDEGDNEGVPSTSPPTQEGSLHPDNNNEDEDESGHGNATHWQTVRYIYLYIHCFLTDACV